MAKIEDLILRYQKITFVFKMLKESPVTECMQVPLSARRKYVLFETVVLNGYIRNIFNDSINHEKCLLKFF